MEYWKVCLDLYMSLLHKLKSETCQPKSHNLATVMALLNRRYLSLPRQIEGLQYEYTWTCVSNLYHGLNNQVNVF